MRSQQERMLDAWQEWYDNLLPCESVCDCSHVDEEECDLCRRCEEDEDQELSEREDFYV